MLSQSKENTLFCAPTEFLQCCDQCTPAASNSFHIQYGLNVPVLYVMTKALPTDWRFVVIGDCWSGVSNTSNHSLYNTPNKQQTFNLRNVVSPMQEWISSFSWCWVLSSSPHFNHLHTSYYLHRSVGFGIRHLGVNITDTQVKHCIFLDPDSCLHPWTAHLGPDPCIPTCDTSFPESWWLCGIVME